MLRESIALGRIFGVRVGLNLSVLVILAILVAGLATGRFPAAYPGFGATAYVLAALAASVLFFASLLAHEVSHAIVARRNGIEVERITLWLFGGVAQLKGDPKSPGADFRIAVVGPLVSIAVGVISAAIAVGLAAIAVPDLAVGIFAYLAGINVLLALFNLVPAAPLDGGRVLRAALWAWRGDRARAAVNAARAGRVFGFVLMALGFVEIFFTEGFGGLWLILIGLFLVHAAMAEEQQIQLTESLRGVRVRDVMTPRPIGADPDERVDEFVSGTAWAYRHSTYPLLDPEGRLLGLATVNRIRGVRHEDRGTTTLRDIACEPAEVPHAAPDEPLVDLLPRMRDCTDGRAVVLDGESRVVGIVSPSDISRTVQARDLQLFDPYRGPRGADLTSGRPGTYPE